jgi:hypothetical protein
MTCPLFREPVDDDLYLSRDDTIIHLAPEVEVD